MSVYDYNVTTSAGEQQSLEQFRGKVLLVVNTATGCGFTPQYEGLEKLYQTYKDQGFEILDFPCNQFMNQAPGTDAEITSFCELTYQTSFPRYAKVEVNGDNAEPLFKFLKTQTPHGVTGERPTLGSRIGRLGGALLGYDIKWNFTKFLIDTKGNVVARFAPTTSPASIEVYIQSLLG